MAQTPPRGQPKIRLFVRDRLAEGAELSLEREQAHYLTAVMRRGPGDRLAIFNGADGEWEAEIAEAGKRGGRLVCRQLLRAQERPPDLWLLFAPLKKARTDFVAEKAAEMGCRRLLPVFTEHTNAERVNRERLAAHGVEAAEQCGLLSVPEVAEPQRLAEVLAAWPADRRLLFCDERGCAPPALEVLRVTGPAPWAALIGPEGGFSAAEAADLAARPFARPASLGPRILRADTAAVAALALLQAAVGDWR